MAAALIFIKARQTKIVPKATDAHPTTQITQPRLQTPVELRWAIAA
jgi:hypothetical protein